VLFRNGNLHFSGAGRRKMQKMLGEIGMLAHTPSLGISRQCFVPAPYHGLSALLGLGSRVLWRKPVFLF
jgi:hypothetical protein